MKLWIFVLLGLLAQTSHGHVTCSYSSIERDLTQKFTSAIHSCKGSSFNFPLLNINSLKLDVLDVLSVKVDVKHIGGGQFQVVITAALSAGCKGFSIPPLGAKIALTVSHGLKNGSPCHEIVSGSLKVSITTSSKIEVIDLSLGGLISGISGILGGVTELVKSLLNTVTSVLIGTLTNTVESALNEVNEILTDLTNTAEGIQCTATKITYGAAGIVYSLSYTVKSTGETIISTASETIADLGAGVNSVWQLSGDVLNVILKTSFPSLTKSIKADKLHGLNLFLDVTGNFDLSITKPSSSHCTTSSEGAVQTVTLGVSLDNILGSLELDVTLDLHFSVRRSKGQFRFNIGESELVTIAVKSRHASCGCDDDGTLIESIEEILEDVIDIIVSALNCEHEHYPIPGISYFGNYDEEDYECPCDNSGISC